MFGGGGLRRREAKRGVTKREGKTTGQRPDPHGTGFQYFWEEKQRTYLASVHTLGRDVWLSRKKKSPKQTKGLILISY